MRRVLFVWRGRRIWSYPALLYTGLVCGLILQTLQSASMGLPPHRVYFATLALLPIALAGSRVLYVATHWATFRAAPHLIWRRGEGGLAMYGGVPLMLVASIPVLAAFRLPFWTYWDSAVFSIFPGMAFARIGCLLNGCCSGRPTQGRFALRLPDEHGHWARRVPVQLLECGVALLILGACGLMKGRLPQPGMLFLIAVAGYATARLGLQRARTERDVARRLDVQAGISVVLILAALSAMALL